MRKRLPLVLPKTLSVFPSASSTLMILLPILSSRSRQLEFKPGIFYIGSAVLVLRAKSVFRVEKDMSRISCKMSKSLMCIIA